MPKFVFSSSDIKQSLSLSKIVKSENTRVRFLGSTVSLSSFDKTKAIMSSAQACETDAPGEYVSPEFLVTSDKKLLLDPKDSDIVVFHVKDSSMEINLDGDSGTKKAVIKTKSNQETPAFDLSNITFSQTILASVLNRSLYSFTGLESLSSMFDQSSHICYDDSSAIFKTRHFMSIVKFPSALNLSLSLDNCSCVSLFCSKLNQNTIRIGEDDGRIYFQSNTGPMLITSKSNHQKRDLTIPVSSGYEYNIPVNREKFLDALKWTAAALDGTHRITISINKSNMSFHQGGHEISSIKINNDEIFSVDASIYILQAFVAGLDDEEVIFRFKHRENSLLFEISQLSDGFQVSHISISMKDR